MLLIFNYFHYQFFRDFLRDRDNLHQIVICSFSICLPFQNIFVCFLPLLPFSFMFSGISHVLKPAKFNNALDFHRLLLYFSSQGNLSNSVELRTLSCF